MHGLHPRDGCVPERLGLVFMLPCTPRNARPSFSMKPAWTWSLCESLCQSCVLPAHSSSFSSTGLCGAHHLPCEDQRDLAAKWHPRPLWWGCDRLPACCCCWLVYTQRRDSGVPPPLAHLTPTSPALHFGFFSHTWGHVSSVPLPSGAHRGGGGRGRSAVWTHPVVVLQPRGGWEEGGGEPLYSVCSVCCSKQRVLGQSVVM